MREREPASMIEELEIELDGATLRGQRVVLRMSDEEIRQEVRYQSLRQVDPDTYRHHEADFMRAVACEILWRLVAQRKAGGTPQPSKLELRPRPRGRTQPRA